MNRHLGRIRNHGFVMHDTAGAFVSSGDLQFRNSYVIIIPNDEAIRLPSSPGKRIRRLPETVAAFGRQRQDHPPIIIPALERQQRMPHRHPD